MKCNKCGYGATICLELVPAFMLEHWDRKHAKAHWSQAPGWAMRSVNDDDARAQLAKGVIPS